jgi:hypothetical protein
MISIGYVVRVASYIYENDDRLISIIMVANDRKEKEKLEL